MLGQYKVCIMEGSIEERFLIANLFLGLYVSMLSTDSKSLFSATAFSLSLKLYCSIFTA
jgi:hypothetical protein